VLSWRQFGRRDAAIEFRGELHTSVHVDTSTAPLMESRAAINVVAACKHGAFNEVFSLLIMRQISRSSTVSLSQPSGDRYEARFVPKNPGGFCLLIMMSFVPGNHRDGLVSVVAIMNGATRPVGARRFPSPSGG
jgi:hypothetical protein